MDAHKSLLRKNKAMSLRTAIKKIMRYFCKLLKRPLKDTKTAILMATNIFCNIKGGYSIEL